MGDTADITAERIARPVEAGPVSYLHVTGRTLGVMFLLLLTTCAWLLSVLPLPVNTLAALGFGLGLVLFLPGAGLARAGLTPGKSLLGGGMAFLFLTTTAVLEEPVPAGYLPAFLSYPYAGPVLCVLLLLLFALMAHRASSPAASLLVCLLAGHLGHIVLPTAPPFARVAWLALAAAALLTWMFLWCATRPGRAFPEMACLLMYAAITVFAGSAAKADNHAFVLAVLSLLSVYALCSILLVRQSVRSGTALTGFAVLNGAAFAAAVWYLTSETGAGTAWLAPAVLLAVGTGAAVAMRRHHALTRLGGLYLCQALLALIALFLMYLPAGPALLAVAGLGGIPAVLGKRVDGQAYRATEYGLIVTALVSSFLLGLPSGPILLGPVAVSAYWLYLLGTAGIFALLGRAHYHWSCDEELHGAFQTEQRLLSLTQLFAAALLIMLQTILHRNDSESLPLLLSMQGIFFLGTGMLLLMPGLAVIGLVPVMAGHVCYHARAFLVPDALGEPEQVWALWPLMIVTLLLALVCDWQLGKRGPGKPLAAEHFLAMLPYLPLLAPLPFVLSGNTPPMLLAAFLGLLGLIALAVTRIPGMNLPGLRALGYAGGILSLCVYVFGLVSAGKDLSPHSLYFPALGLYLVTLVLMERATETPCARPTWLRRALPPEIALLGIIGLYLWNNAPVYAVALAGFALLLSLTGYVFRVRAYYHAALLTLIVAAVWLLLSITGMALPGMAYGSIGAPGPGLPMLRG